MLLLSTHNRLMWSSSDVLHEGRGVYHGAFKGPQGTIWSVSRGITKEALLNIDPSTGQVLKEVPVPSVFTHDLVKSGDQVYVTDCGGGRIIIFNFPDFSIKKSLQVCTSQNHMNTVAVDPLGNLWCLLHNLGKSILVRVDEETGEWLETNYNVGNQSHGLAWWDQGFLILSSGSGALLHVTPKETKVLWVDTGGSFLKGLCVHEGLAYFGASKVTTRSHRGASDLNCDLCAFNLVTGELIWRRVMETRGLLNSIMWF